MKKIQIFCDVILWHWVSGSQHFKGLVPLSSTAKQSKMDFKFLANEGFLFDNIHVTATACWDTK
jgi:hypothetical protein